MKTCLINNLNMLRLRSLRGIDTRLTPAADARALKRADRGPAAARQPGALAAALVAAGSVVWMTAPADRWQIIPDETEGPRRRAF